ncbi:MAG TPA: PIN domain-containing protein [Pseudonocardia sp.]|uniref:PIN domain-containing protein n=1 Tax=Pseudonocardia sp. TaxID=60912 RepID=UPI002CE070F9|nr:PIN domain-containing protein [Pseudonocardia sp.]HTF54842.1 PIN domain-containing protein [Pseudonocardia sp.]
MTVFVDTNVLVYAHDPTERRKSAAADALLVQLWENGAGALSTQVLQEFYNVATGKLRPQLSPSRARSIVGDYAEWAVVETTPQLIVSASMLHECHGISFWDALIVEAALLAGADTLLTEDLQDGRRFGDLTVRNPFLDTRH